uniref:Uncharacterized protein n=1 Tax=Plectus sambesii TaxID=2011161 RepID=A0A914W1E0_9BILA
MSLSGLRKQLNKANQYLSETVGTAEATKLDEEYVELERKVDATSELINALIAGTHEYLQPNPATRAKMATMGALSKVRGTSKSSPYPQTEGLLADSMLRYGQGLGTESYFGKALVDASESFKQMADIKYALEDAVKQSFLDPMAHLLNSDLKDCMHHRSKLKGRRLDYDCKKRKQTKDDELYQAEEKLEESKRLAETAMYNVLDNDVEQISQLCALVDAQLDFHRQTTQVLEGLQQQLKNRVKEASSRPRQNHQPKPVLSDRSPRSRSPAPSEGGMATNNGKSPSMGGGSNQDPFSVGESWTATNPPPSYNSVQAPPQAASGPRQPSCKALYDFEAENEGELPFREGQIITLVSQIDENWYEGTVSGRSGFFPIAYVQVVVPLP